MKLTVDGNCILPNNNASFPQHCQGLTGKKKQQWHKGGLCFQRGDRAAEEVPEIDQSATDNWYGWSRGKQQSNTGVRTTINVQQEKVAKGFGEHPGVSSCYSVEEHRASRIGHY